MSSFQQGLSGLNATSKSLEVIGNNVANAGTYGAKSSRAEFGDMYANMLGGPGTQDAGIGVSVQAVTQQFKSGSITSTENPLDLAINGGGFFEVSDGGSVMYTRNGQFQTDKNGYVVNNAGMKLMGYPADANGVIQAGQSQPLQQPLGGIEPKVTSSMSLVMNLDSRLATTDTGATPAVNFTDAKTYNNASSVTAYDAKGQNVALTYYFQKSADDTWNVYATSNGTSVSTDVDGNPTPVTTLTFPSDGSSPLTGSKLSFDIPASTNAQGATTVPITGVTLDLSKTTQYGSQFGVSTQTQDGYAAGQMSGLSIEATGVVMANYSNGQTKAVGQVELANFRNPQGLQPRGGNVWSSTYASGDPTVGVPGGPGLGELQSGALEESNVDLTAELVNMITAQRMFQANSQTIKTQDQILQTLVNLR